MIGVPLFVSRRRLARYRHLPHAVTDWALDSGGFSELALFGRWTFTPEQYANEVRRYRQEIGRLQFAAAMDWMCEPAIIEKTGLSVEEHQGRTVENYLRLKEIAPDLPWLPVLQGWERADYERHLIRYRREGVALDCLPLVGLGSVCRRQHTDMVEELVRNLASGQGLRLHGFGIKVRGLSRCGNFLTSADSMAWNQRARFDAPHPACVGKHRHCTNCLRYALAWRERLYRRLTDLPAYHDVETSRSDETADVF
jgi:hypothetical protein